MKRVTFVKDACWFEWIKEKRPESLSSGLVCALNLDSYSLMRDLGIECVGAWDYLTQQDMVEVVESATRLSKQWLEPFKQLAKPFCVDVLEAGRVETLDFFREGVYASQVIHKILESEKPSIISLPEKGEHLAFAQRSHSIFEGAALYLLEQRGIQIDSIKPLPQIQSSRRQNIKEKILPLIPPPVLGGYRSVRRILEERARAKRGIRLLSLQDLQTSDLSEMDQPKVVVIGAYQDFLMLIDLAHKLETESKYHTLRIHVPSGAYDFAEIIRTQSTYKDMIHVQPLVADGLEYLSLEGLAEFQMSYRRHQPLIDSQRFQELKNASAELCPEIFSNPYLEYQFKYYITEFWPHVAASVETMHEILKIVKPQLVIGANGSANDRACLLVAQAEGIRTLLLVSGYPGDLEGLNYPTDYIAAQGENLKRRLVDIGKSEQQVVTTGHIKFDRSIFSVETNRLRSKELGEKLGLVDGRKVILFLTTDIGYAHFPGMNLTTHYDTLERIIEIAGRMPEVYFLFKPHPRFDQISTYRRLIQKHNAANALIVENVNVDEIVPLAEFAVLVNGITTAMFHVLLQKKPVLFMLTARGAFPECESSFLECCGTLNVMRIEDIEQALAKMLQDSQERNLWIRRGRALFEDCMHVPDGAASSRVVALVQKALEKN